MDRHGGGRECSLALFLRCAKDGERLLRECGMGDDELVDVPYALAAFGSVCEDGQWRALVVGGSSSAALPAAWRRVLHECAGAGGAAPVLRITQFPWARPEEAERWLERARAGDLRGLERLVNRLRLSARVAGMARPVLSDMDVRRLAPLALQHGGLPKEFERVLFGGRGRPSSLVSLPPSLLASSRGGGGSPSAASLSGVPEPARPDPVGRYVVVSQLGRLVERLAGLEARCLIPKLELGCTSAYVASKVAPLMWEDVEEDAEQGGDGGEDEEEEETGGQKGTAAAPTRKRLRGGTSRAERCRDACVAHVRSVVTSVRTLLREVLGSNFELDRLAETLVLIAEDSAAVSEVIPAVRRPVVKAGGEGGEEEAAGGRKGRRTEVVRPQRIRPVGEVSLRWSMLDLLVKEARARDRQHHLCEGRQPSNVVDLVPMHVFEDYKRAEERVRQGLEAVPTGLDGRWRSSNGGGGGGRMGKGVYVDPRERLYALGLRTRPMIDFKFKGRPDNQIRVKGGAAAAGRPQAKRACPVGHSDPPCSETAAEEEEEGCC